MEPTPNDSTPTASRAKVRVWQWFALGVAVLVFAAAYGFLRSSSVDRDAAVKSHQQAARLLAVERTATHDAEDKVADVKHQASMQVGPAETAIAKMGELLAIADQQATEAQTTQRIGADAAASADDYNASVDRNNTIVDQYNAKLTELQQLVDDVEHSLSA
ncbi:MAG TPA: hypothetical protein VGN51_13805 [Acidimicrobiia bacterium]|jgi:hypothetical protein